ncbi:MAG: FAD-dependent oxidoreductase [Planctomycetota bacterium]
MSPPEVLVVGQGLAGSLLALELLDRGRRVLVVDADRPHAASPVSAGMVNPIAGPKHNRPWAWDPFAGEARARYASLERRFGIRLVRERAIHFAFRSAEDRERFLARDDHDALAPHLGEIHAPGTLAPELADEHGGFEILGAFALDVPALLRATRAELLARGAFRPVAVAVEGADGDPLGDGTRPDTTVLCTGHHAASAGPFRRLPWRVSRGERLDVRLLSTPPRTILNREKWLLPLEDDRAQIGAIYAWDDAEAGPTEKGRRELETAGRAIGASDFEVVDHRAGARAGGIDWRPYLGRAADRSEIAILGGLGSKGALYAPGCARRLAEHLFEGAALDPELDVARRRPR